MMDTELNVIAHDQFDLELGMQLFVLTIDYPRAPSKPRETWVFMDLAGAEDLLRGLAQDHLDYEGISLPADDGIIEALLLVGYVVKLVRCLRCSSYIGGEAHVLEKDTWFDAGGDPEIMPFSGGRPRHRQ
jgi:hypothetical protein